MSSSTPFLPFLPLDNRSLGSAETETFIECLSDDLGRLLSQSNARFWQRAGNDSTLYSCLDSYVQFVRSYNILYISLAA